MPTITDIREKKKTANGKGLVDIRPQVKDLYFSVLKEYKDPKKKDASLTIDPVDESELWDLQNKLTSETLTEFIKRHNVSSLDNLYEMSDNGNVMTKNTVDFYISNSGATLINYDFSQVSANANNCFLAADTIDLYEEEQLSIRLNKIEDYKYSFKDKKLHNLLQNIFRLKANNESLKATLKDIENEADGYLILDEARIEAQIKTNETQIETTRKEIISAYTKEQTRRKNSAQLKNKLEYAVGKKSNRVLTGSLKLERLIDIGSKSDLIVLGEPVILVVETIGVPNDTEFKIKIKQKEDGGPIAKDQAYKLLDGDNEADEFVFKVANQELDSSRKVRKVTTINYPSKYRGYAIAYDETTNYQNKIPDNSKTVTNAAGEKIIIQRSLIQFSAKKKEEEAYKKLEDDIKKMTDQKTSIYIEVIYPDNTIKIKGADLAGKTGGKYFGISKGLSLGLFDLDLLPDSNFLSNDKENLELAVVDGALVWKTVAIAFLKMKAAAKKEGIDLAVNSGYRPAFGNNSKVTSSKGNIVEVWTQESLRRGKGRWVDGEREKYSSDHDFIFNAGASAYDPPTAAPGKSEHGNGRALDLNTGSWACTKFTALDEKKYIWLINNSFNYGFVRTVKKEEWHFEYYPGADGPYYKLEGTNGNLFYKSLKLDESSINLNKTKGQMDYVKE